MVEYASVAAAVTFFVTSLAGLTGSAIPASSSRAAGAVQAAARAHDVSSPAARAAFKQAPYTRVQLRYLYALGWVGAASDLASCKAEELLGPDPVTAATTALKGSPQALAALRAAHLTVKQAATALGKGTAAGCG